MEYLAQYAAYLRLKGQSPKTIRHRRFVIGQLPMSEPLHATRHDLEQFLGRFESASTRRSYRGALRSFFQWAHAEGLIDADPSADLPPIKVAAGTPHPVSDEQLRALLASTSGQLRAVVLLMAYCGLRISEAHNVHPDDLWPDANGGWRLHIRRAKGGDSQVVPIPAWVATQVRSQVPYSFGIQTLHNRLRAAFDALGIDLPAHSLRHWFGTTALRTCGNVRVVQTLMRHKSLASTQIYTAVCDVETSAVSEHLPHCA